MLSCIVNNPFRILGVPSNASKKEILTHSNKINAFLKVGKPIVFPLDLDTTLPDVGRTVESVTAAVKSIERPQDQLVASLFWFANATPIDRIAINHLTAGSLDRAIEIWSKTDNVSSLLNRCVGNLILENWREAAIVQDKLFSKYSDEICDMIGDNLSMTPKKLLSAYFDKIATRDYQTLFTIYADIFLSGASWDFSAVSDLWRSCISRAMAAKQINELEADVTLAKSASPNNADECWECAKRILDQDRLGDLDILLYDDRAKFFSLCTKAVGAALQCAINFYNNAADQDEIAEEAYKLIEIAYSLAPPNSMLRQRCEDNLNEMRKICKKLPPASVKYYHRLLKARIEKYGNEPPTIANASQFIKDCAPYLMSIKGILGESSDYYIEVCTRVANDALSNIIDDYNQQSDDLYKRFNAGIANRSVVMSKLQAMMKSAVIALYHIKSLGLNSDFRMNRFIPNYATISKEARTIRALGTTSNPSGEISEHDFYAELSKYHLDTRDERAYFTSIKSVSDCCVYRKLFPEGQYIADVAKIEEDLEYKECSTPEQLARFRVRYPNTKYDLSAKLEEIVFNSCKTIRDYEYYLTKYSTYRAQALRRIDDIAFSQCFSNKDFEEYLAKYPNGSHRMEAMYKVDDNDFHACATIADYQKYVTKHPNGCHLVEAWNRIAEEQFWQLCCKEKSRKLYLEYISRYPQGKHLAEAERNSRSTWGNVYANVALHIQRHKGWCIAIGIALTILLTGLIWGLSAYVVWLYAIGSLGVLAALKYIYVHRNSKDADAGCGVMIICAILAVAGFVGANALKDYVNENPSISASTIRRDWNTEQKAWTEAAKIDRIKGYAKYIELYPKGKHVYVANKRIIDLEVDKLMKGKHGSLPKLDQISYDYGAFSTISVFNNSKYTLTLYYSGPDSKKIVLAPRTSQSVTLANGSYRCVATVDNSSVSNYAGTENLTGGSYGVEYYIYVTRRR